MRGLIEIITQLPWLLSCASEHSPRGHVMLTTQLRVASRCDKIIFKAAIMILEYNCFGSPLQKDAEA